MDAKTNLEELLDKTLSEFSDENLTSELFKEEIDDGKLLLDSFWQLDPK